MAALDFPSSPLVGDKYPQPGIPNKPMYTWDGVKWTTFGDIVDDTIGASSAVPLMNAGDGAAGAEENWSRGDHVHPAKVATPAAGDNSTLIATTEFVTTAVASGITTIGIAAVLVADTPPADVPDRSLWWNSSDGLLYVRYTDIDSPQWVLASPMPEPPTVTLKGISAAPFNDALAYSGMQVNGAFDVSQEAGTATRGTTGYVCDGWVLTKTLGGAGVVSFGQSASAGIYPNAMSNMLLGSVPTAQATLAATDVVSVTTRIEGYRVARLGWGGANAKSITIGFWTGHTPAGQYSVSVHNGADNRSYTTSYTQMAASMLQYNTITIPGDGPPGAWTNTNTVGMSIVFTMAAGVGALQTSSTEQWLAGNPIAATGQINGLSNTANSFKLAQVVVVPGSQAPTSEQSANIMRPYDQELTACKRYYQKYPNTLVETAALYHSIALPVEMRIIPVITGGGAGFASTNTTAATLNCSQTTRALQTIVLDARL